MTPPPVDLSILGQMAVLGDFDAITPVMMSGQQNTFESNTFSILELSKVVTGSAGSEPNHQKILSVPVLLASFGIDADESGRAPAYGISATCVLESAPHQIYIGGYFRQTPSSWKFAANQSNGTFAPDKASTTSTSNSVRKGLNYVGLYDSKLKRFLAMENGLDGPVENLMCDSSTNQVFVVGQFRAPLQDETFSDSNKAGGGNSNRYQALGSFGGGVAVWKRAPGTDSGAGGSSGKSSYNNQLHPPTQASGSWAPLPFKGVNKIVTSVAKTQDGTYYFGGQFDTTTDGEEFSAPDTQLVNLASAQVNTGNGLDVAQDRSIICQNGTSPRTNWIMRDNMPGYWRVKFPLLITPTLFRLWNVDVTQGSESTNRGTKTFAIMAQPSNQYLNLSYTDPISHTLQYCTVCPLLPRPSSSTESLPAQSGYQDFLVAKPELLHAAQIDVVSWYGLGGGLGGVEVYQSEIFARAVDSLNFAAKCASSEAAMSTEGTHENRDLTAYSSFMGADWVQMRMPDGWQTVLAASVSASDDAARKQAYVDMAPYLQEQGMYDVFFYTPACGSSKDASSSPSMPSNACANRGSIDVSMYFGSPQNVVTVTLQQTNTADKYEKIYSGMIVRSTPDFRPHVVVKPSAIKAGTSGGGATQTVIVDSIQFVKQATLNNTNSLLFYRPGSGQSTAGGDGGKSGKNMVEGIDSSTWGNLATQLPGGASVNALIAYSGSFGTSTSSASSSSTLIIAGEFQSSGYSNIVAWDGGKFVRLGQTGGASSGLDGTVADMVLEQSTLHMVGTFQQAYGSAGEKGATLLAGLASYSIPSMTWTSFGNVSQNFQPGARFKSIELSTGANGQPQLLIGGTFTWIDRTKSASLAIWDIGTQTWVREDPEASGDGSTSGSNGFSFGFMRGQISYLSRVLASSSDGSTTHKTPVVLVAGMIHSVDTYQLQQPESMAWLTDAGKLSTWNLSPVISVSPGNASTTLMSASTEQLTTLEKTNSGVLYMNPGSQEWVTVVGGALAGGTIGIGFLRPSQERPGAFVYKNLNVAAATSSSISGEVLALGIDKDETNGHNSLNEGSDLLLIGGAFKSPGGSGASEVNGVALFDLTADVVVPATLMPVMRGVSGMAGRDPVVRVIKSRPGSNRGTLVLAGDFSGVGTGVTCELICLWDPAEARKALDKNKSLESSFKSVYGDNGSNKKHLGILRGVVNDIAFEDDSNMFVAGDLVVNGVPCGAASFNFDSGRWTTFGSIISASKGAEARPLASEFMPTSEIYRLEILPASKDAPDRTSGSASASNYDSNDNTMTTNNDISTSSTNNGNNSSEGVPFLSADHSSDTTVIVEQGFILLVSGRIVLGDPSSASAMSLNNDRQESSLAFFDGQSWFPYLQSSRNGSSPSLDGSGSGSPAIGPGTPVSTIIKPDSVLKARHLLPDLSILERADPMASTMAPEGPASAVLTTLPMRVRDQGVFRALAIAHLPRIIAREYLSLLHVILVSMAISLALIALIVLLGFLFMYMKRRLSGEEEQRQRPRLATSYMESGDGPQGRNGGNGGLYFTDSSLGVNQSTAFGVGASPEDNKKAGRYFFRKWSRGGRKEPDSTEALMASLGITSALEVAASRRGGHLRRGGDSGAGSQIFHPSRPHVYRPNSTIEEATGALVTEFVRNHQQQLTGGSQQALDRQSSEEGPQAPPSPDRRSKKSRHSYPYNPPVTQGRDSSSSDLMNPITQGRFASLLAAADAQDPATPQSQAPTSPATTMTTPGGAIGSNFADLSPHGSGGVVYYAKYPFRAREIGELGFKAGERILVVDMSDDIWWMGVIQDANGQQVHGVFPSNYVGTTP
ncbi:hypothetical protein BGZ70_004506 [Mortierella alpina]|uniref:SH3 domain-containing protein n=1 Tax=Mortierella alpina TaxID=64518 RepID=A0A9P6J9Z8_MORAP|nr:hypothetical protein BGZ70_004506 [Mortierella alpina]